MKPDIQYRLLTVADLEIFRELRLHGCREEPGAFLQAYEELVEKPLDYFKPYLQESWVAGAFMDGRLVGKAGIFREKGMKVRHKATLWGVYVMQEARGHGMARRCIEMALHEATQAGVEQVLATTDVQNPVTVGLYKRIGFEPWGVEKHIIKLPDRYVDDMVMTKVLP